MLKVDAMLMIGSAGRNVGKTELACAIINKFSKSKTVPKGIIGVKVTPIETKDGQCPRGGTGCGVCSSLEGNFHITEELNKDSRKDTARLLAAGASRVFWVRSLKSHLEEAVAALLDIIGTDAVMVCESNSLRKVVEPGFFIMAKRTDTQIRKTSAKEVMHYADRIASFDGSGVDIDLSDINIIDGRWAVKMKATAAVLGGGQSSRMGQDKSMLPVKGQPIIKYICDRLGPHFDQILISASDVSRYDFAGVDVVPDKAPGRGPLMGIASALQASANQLNFVVACDIPEFDMTIVKQMLRLADDCDAVIPATGQSKYEPLFAVYNKTALDSIEASLATGNNRIIEALDDDKIKYIELADNQRPKNINTMDDYRQFIKGQTDAAV